jgi:hypothetical protein
MIFMIIVAIVVPRNTGPPEEITPSEFAHLAKADLLLVSSGAPLELFTDKTNGQQYMRGNYGTSGRQGTITYFQVPVSASPDDEAMNAARKAGLEVIKATKPLSQATRWCIAIAVSIVLIPAGCFLTLKELKRH